MTPKNLSLIQNCLFICNGGNCLKKSGEQTTLAMREQITRLNLEERYHTARTRCMGRCDDAPVVVLSKNNIWLKEITDDKCETTIKEIETHTILKSPSLLYSFQPPTKTQIYP